MLPYTENKRPRLYMYAVPLVAGYMIKNQEYISEVEPGAGLYGMTVNPPSDAPAGRSIAAPEGSPGDGF